MEYCCISRHSYQYFPKYVLKEIAEFLKYICHNRYDFCLILSKATRLKKFCLPCVMIIILLIYERNMNFTHFIMNAFRY